MPSRPGDPRNTAAYRRLKAEYLLMARAAGQPCGLCGSKDPPPDQVHHTIPISWDVGDPFDTNLWMPAHGPCNNRQQDKPTPRNPLNTSRDW
jgi:5-methylcytosine-specific restriction endonuclease McrA